MIIRLETAYRHLQEHAVELPEEVKGWFLLRKLQVDSTAEAMIMTTTKGSLKYPDVVEGVRAIFPQGVKPSGGHKLKEVFEATSADGEPSAEDAASGDETIEEVFQAVAEQLQSNEDYDDEEALDVFENYKEVRRKMQQKKLGRGYRGNTSGPSAWKLTGTMQGKIEAMKAASHCHICKQKGHWKRECPRKTASDANKGKGRGSSDAMLALETNFDNEGGKNELFIP